MSVKTKTVECGHLGCENTTTVDIMLVSGPNEYTCIYPADWTQDHDTKQFFCPIHKPYAGAKIIDREDTFITYEYERPDFFNLYALYSYYRTRTNDFAVMIKDIEDIGQQPDRELFNIRAEAHLNASILSAKLEHIASEMMKKIRPDTEEVIDETTNES